MLVSRIDKLNPPINPTSSKLNSATTSEIQPKCVYSSIVPRTAKWIEQIGKAKQSSGQIQDETHKSNLPKSSRKTETIFKTSKYNAKKKKLKTLERENLPKEDRSLWKEARKPERKKCENEIFERERNGERNRAFNVPEAENSSSRFKI